MTDSDKEDGKPGKNTPPIAAPAAKSDAGSTAKKAPVKKAPPTKDAAPKKSRKSAWRFFKPGRVLWIAIILLLAWLAWPIWGPFTPGWMQTVLAPVMEAGRTPGLARKVEGIEQRVVALEATVKSLVAEGAGGSNADVAANRAALGSLTAKLGALDARLTAIEAIDGNKTAISELSDRLKAAEAALAALAARPVETSDGKPVVIPPELIARLTRIESENTALRQQLAVLSQQIKAATAARDTSDPAGVMMLAVGQLRAAAARTGGWQAQWRTVAALAADDPVLGGPVKTLAPFAETGVADLGQLRARFPSMADRVARATPARLGESWIDRTIDRLSGLITIRRTGEDAKEMPGDDGVLARAESQLKNQDLAAAVKTLDGLSPAGKKAAASWIRDAQARLTVDQALETLQASLLAKASARPGG